MRVPKRRRTYKYPSTECILITKIEKTRYDEVATCQVILCRWFVKSFESVRPVGPATAQERLKSNPPVLQPVILMLLFVSKLREFLL